VRAFAPLFQRSRKRLEAGTLMRIAIINWSRRRVGGVETYLNTIIPELARAGHEMAFCSEVDEPADRELIDLPENSPAWCVAGMGQEPTLAGLKQWEPDVIYSHKLADPDLERKILGLAPSVFFAHDYNGTCISGTKTFKFPVVQPCSRTFGWQCLVHYFPHRCGGLSPVTMLKLYSLQSKRLENLHAYDAIVTHSDHMLAELMKHGLSPQRADNVPYYVQSANAGTKPDGQLNELGIAFSPLSEKFGSPENTTQLPSKGELNILFSGRMEYLKGAHVFIDALPKA
jgi:glycosyltransferase involved in cell wall biosynthesis